MTHRASMESTTTSIYSQNPQNEEPQYRPTDPITEEEDDDWYSKRPEIQRRCSLPIADAYAKLIGVGEADEDVPAVPDLPESGPWLRRCDSSRKQPEEEVQESPIIAELYTNVIIDDTRSIVTDLSLYLAAQYTRPTSAIMIEFQHSACLALNSSFESCYRLNLSVVPSSSRVFDSKATARQMKSFLADILGVPPHRGMIHLQPLAPENVAMSGVLCLESMRETVEEAEVEEESHAGEEVNDEVDEHLERTVDVEAAVVIEEESAPNQPKSAEQSDAVSTSYEEILHEQEQTPEEEFVLKSVPSHQATVQTRARLFSLNVRVSGEREQVPLMPPTPPDTPSTPTKSFERSPTPPELVRPWTSRGPRSSFADSEIGKALTDDRPKTMGCRSTPDLPSTASATPWAAEPMPTLKIQEFAEGTAGQTGEMDDAARSVPRQAEGFLSVPTRKKKSANPEKRRPKSLFAQNLSWANIIPSIGSPKAPQQQTSPQQHSVDDPREESVPSVQVDPVPAKRDGDARRSVLMTALPSVPMPMPPPKTPESDGQQASSWSMSEKAKKMGKRRSLFELVSRREPSTKA